MSALRYLPSVVRVQHGLSGLSLDRVLRVKLAPLSVHAPLHAATRFSLAVSRDLLDSHARGLGLTSGDEALVRVCRIVLAHARRLVAVARA